MFETFYADRRDNKLLLQRIAPFADLKILTRRQEEQMERLVVSPRPHILCKFQQLFI